ncbi:MAG: NADH-quinone oxidoreductase subunit I [Bacteroidia bacterium]|nr:NADH-quinone oxidoreductase subunit I [Bacteroidia bacterium]MDW8158679.1 NADH-quinone oxidoreductase subunit I [Bacteroidia bacterium]
MVTYIKAIYQTSKALLKGLLLTYRQLRKSLRRRVPEGINQASYFQQQAMGVTICYPEEKIPVPDVGRYRLYMETEDCIGCDQCARICPVDCITIEKIKAPDVIGFTSDGTKKRFYLPSFDIDMAKCCYCGLCTIVCPTECLTMTKVYDYSEYDRKNLIYHFGNLSLEEAELKRKEIAEIEAQRKAAKAAAIEANKD